jgi:hypothetical protein
MKRNFKRILAAVLAVALLTGTFAFLFSTGAGALDLSKTYEVSSDHTLTDQNGNKFT